MKPSQRLLVIQDAQRGGNVALAIAATAYAVQAFRHLAGLHYWAMDYGATVVFVVGLVLHCAFDARIRRIPFPMSLLWLICGFWFLAVPGYWIYVEGTRGLRRVILGAVGLFGIGVLCGSLGFWCRFLLR